MNEKKLGEILKINSGFPYKRYTNKNTNPEEKYKLLKINSKKEIEEETIKINKKIKEEYLLNKNDIIMKLTPNFEAKRINSEKENLTVPINYVIIHTNNNINPIILEYILNSKAIKNQLKRLGNPTIIKSINIKTIKELKIPIFQDNEEEIIENIILAFIERKKLFNNELNLIEKQINSIIFGG